MDLGVWQSWTTAECGCCGKSEMVNVAPRVPEFGGALVAMGRHQPGESTRFAGKARTGPVSRLAARRRWSVYNGWSGG